ncbi:hypothetical protein Tco_0836731 [Tanacetum coccineum]
MWCLYDPTPSDWCKMDVHSTDYGPKHAIDHSAVGKLREKITEESWELIEDLALYDNKSWNDPKDFSKPVKEISLPQDVPSTSDCRIIELENQVQRSMEDHLALKPSVQIKKISFSCDIYSGPHDTQYCMENPEQAFIDYASSRINEAREDEFKDLHLNLPVLEALTHAPMYNAILDKFVESLELGKNRHAFIQGEMLKKMKDPRLFTLPCRLEDSKHFDTLADLGSYVNLIPLYLFKTLNIGLLEETKNVLGLPDRTVISDRNCEKRRVKELGLGHVDTPYLTTLAKRKSYESRPSTDDIDARPPYYLEKDFMNDHLPGEWEIARDAELNPFKEILDLIDKKIDWNMPPKEGDVAWNIKFEMIDSDGEKFDRIFQSILTTRKVSKKRSKRYHRLGTFS